MKLDKKDYYRLPCPGEMPELYGSPVQLAVQKINEQHRKTGGRSTRCPDGIIPIRTKYY